MIGQRGRMRNRDELFAALNRSKFRSRFRLGEKGCDYLDRKGLEEVLEHADKFVRERIGSAQPRNDGKQTPMRGHPVFVSQHATATCCRSCLAKWHGIEKDRPLAEDEVRHVVEVIRRWIIDGMALS